MADIEAQATYMLHMSKSQQNDADVVLAATDKECLGRLAQLMIMTGDTSLETQD